MMMMIIIINNKDNMYRKSQWRQEAYKTISDACTKTSRVKSSNDVLKYVSKVRNSAIFVIPIGKHPHVR